MRYLFFFFFFSSCSFFSHTDKKSKKISTVFLHPNWSAIHNNTNNQADFSFQEKNNKSILLINSICEKYQLTPLEKLEQNILIGFSNLKQLSKKDLTFHGRTAIERHYSGNVDGVPSFFKFLLFKKNNCLYDIFFIAPSLNLLESNEHIWNEFLNSIIITP